MKTLVGAPPVSGAKGKRPNELAFAMKVLPGGPLYLSTRNYKGFVLISLHHEHVWLTARQADRLALTLARCAEQQRRIDRWDRPVAPKRKPRKKA